MQAFSSSPRMFSSFRTFSPTAGGGNPKHDYAVGGGQVLNGTDCSTENFALSGHVLAGATLKGVGGTFNLSCQPSIVGQGHASSLVAKIDCLQVSSPNANFHATVTHINGAAFSAYTTDVYGAVMDLGPGPGDMINWSASNPSGSNACSNVAPSNTTSHGNISVHQAA
jgi:hypothetical protein